MQLQLIFIWHLLSQIGLNQCPRRRQPTITPASGTFPPGDIFINCRLPSAPCQISPQTDSETNETQPQTHQYTQNKQTKTATTKEQNPEHPNWPGWSLLLCLRSRKILRLKPCFKNWEPPQKCQLGSEKGPVEERWYLALGEVWVFSSSGNWGSLG